MMDAKTEADRFIGIDVSKARVDVHVRPDGIKLLIHRSERGGPATGRSPRAAVISVCQFRDRGRRC